MAIHAQLTLYDERTDKPCSVTLADGEELIIGREPNTGTKKLQIKVSPQLVNDCISANHIRIVMKGSGLEAFDGIADNKPSKNGSYVNGERINGQGIPLKTGDVLGFGYAQKSHYDFEIKIAYMPVDDSIRR
jgi:pSer/pThr/pTyr-binding forkhead associated (FHA) protein